MSRKSQSSAVSRNYVLARDLENLPVELIEEVIKEVNFEQAIRLSSWAGPQLQHAFATSPSWRQCFGTEEDRSTWQRYLQLTDRLNVLCFDTRRDPRAWFKESMPYGGWRSGQEQSKHRDISFLQRGSSSLIDDTSRLRSRWQDALRAVLNNGLQFLDDPSFRNLDLHLSGRLISLREDSSDHKVFVEDDIESGIRLCQSALSARKSSLAGELRRLASLYEAHPGLLKVPYASQNSMPSARHVPQQLRYRASKLEKAPLSFWTNGGGRSYFHNEFLPLVPFDWTLRFLVTVLESEQASIDDKTQHVVEGLAYYFLRGVEPRGRQDIRTAGTPWSAPLYRQQQLRFLAGREGPKWFRDTAALIAHRSEELSWVEAFVEVISGLIERFPHAVVIAQDGETRSDTTVKELEKLEIA